MMAALIFAFSVLTLLMFFVSYCRSLVAASSKHALSREVRDITGISGPAVGQDFARVTQLLQLCPDRPEDRPRLKAVGAYYNLLGFLQSSVVRFMPSLQAWMEQERAGCANFAAVVLDRRIAFSREIIAREGDF